MILHIHCNLTHFCSYTVKKVSDFSLPPQPECHLPNSPWPGIFILFPSMGRVWFVSDIPVEDGKNANRFLQCTFWQFLGKFRAMAIIMIISYSHFSHKISYLCSVFSLAIFVQKEQIDFIDNDCWMWYGNYRSHPIQITHG